ncbi:fibroblast growth factor 1 isoform X2 [Rhineura floridana]|uniref:fibroblast growth factor 1 isoform X2 n=1 Tax=Rhineura floridana TaxID=261503 RepID=UPI002AC80A8D|nr:fibroblast growth factor 1 isoform X2 [Rhineura floridana]
MAEGEITTFIALKEKFDLPMGNYKKPKLLYCSNGGHFLRILPDGKVDGTMDRNDRYRAQGSKQQAIQHHKNNSIKDVEWERSLLKVQLLLSAENVGEVYIKSTESGEYLAMDANGRLYGSLPTEECLFLERIEENHYNTYTSKMHTDKKWFVGLKKNGKSKLGPRTHYGQKAILFLPLPVSPD